MFPAKNSYSDLTYIYKIWWESLRYLVLLGISYDHYKFLLISYPDFCFTYKIIYDWLLNIVGIILYDYYNYVHWPNYCLNTLCDCFNLYVVAKAAFKRAIKIIQCMKHFLIWVDLSPFACCFVSLCHLVSYMLTVCISSELK